MAITPQPDTSNMAGNGPRVRRIRVSVVMYGGLSYGGAHKLIIRMLCHLDMTRFKVTYFWCEPGEDIGSDFVWPELDYSNIDLLRAHGVDVVQFSVAGRDTRNRYHPWLETDFFERYREVETDVVLTSRSGHTEYPFFLLREPVVEWNIFGDADRSANLVHSVATSDYTHRRWLKRAVRKPNSIIYPGVPEPAEAESFRQELGIGADVVVLGFHQRNDDNIYGEHTLRAYAKALPQLSEGTAFIILGGSPRYLALIQELGVHVHVLPIAKNPTAISRFLRTLDIFAHSGGAGEALGVVFQEAMMHSLPSITMLLQGRPDGQVATLAGSGIVTRSVTEYAEAIVELVNSKERRKQLGKLGHAVAVSKYAMPAVGREFSNLLQRVYQKYEGRKFSPDYRAQIDMLLESSPSYRELKSLLRRAVRR